MIKKILTYGVRLYAGLWLLSGAALAAPSYNDVLVVVNDSDTSTVVVNGLTKPVSVAVGEYFHTQRNMPAQNLCHVSISPAQGASNATYQTLLTGVTSCLAQTGVDGRPLNESVNYIVLTKGMPISYSDPVRGSSSVGNALFADLTGLAGTSTHPYFSKREHFSKPKFNMYLVTYLIGYDYAQSIALVDRASQAFGNTGKLVLDRGVYWSITKPWFMDARTPMEARGFTGVYDWDPANDNLPSNYITDVSGIMMYHSSGSNDGYCPAPDIHRLGFVPGAIGDTYVSSSGRSFLYDTSGGLAKFAGSAFTRYAKATEQDLPYRFTGAIAFDGATIWAATGPQSSGATKLNGIYLFDAATAMPTGVHFTTANSGLANNKVNDIVVDGDWIWIATATGLSRYNKSTAAWDNVSSFGLSTANLYDIEVDVANNELWVAYSGSVRRYNRSTGALLNAYTTANGLLSTYAPSLSLDAGGLWIATSAGLQFWDRASASLFNYTTANGLRDNYVRVVRAGQTKIWVGYQNSVNSVNLGVSALDRASATWTHYYYDPASPATSPLDNSAPLEILIEPGDSRVWVATGGRINAYTAATGLWTNYPISAVKDLAYDGTSVWASATRAGQSLIADLIHDGITGVQGYVAEPYVDAISLPGILYPRYSDGYNLAESFYMASNEIRWKNIVVGDPKAAPFAPRVAAFVPVSGASGFAVDASASASFSSPGMGSSADMNWSSFDTTTITAKTAGGASEALKLTFDRSTQTVKLNPTTFWKGSTAYTIALKGGPAGIRNSAGASIFEPSPTVHANDITWSFTTEADSDNDGLSSTREATLGTNPNAADTDGDGVNDGIESFFGTNPVSASSMPNLSADTDGDGLSNADELAYRTNPNLADTDGDGIDDKTELYFKYSPSNAASMPDLNADYDGDGLNNQGEYNAGTDPYAADTDGDGLTDGEEVNTYGTNPLSNADLDGDGLTDSAEIKIHLTAYNNPDTDGDGLNDGAEVNVHGTNPKVVDTDGDRLTDGEEIDIYRTNPLSAADGDLDGMPNDWEQVRGTNPAVDDARGDLDNDGVDNVIEYLRRTLPNDATSKPAIKTVYVDAANTSGVEDGTAANPYNTVEEGITAALAGDTVSVASGTYTITTFLTIGKSIRLIGPANRSAVINANWLYLYSIKWGEWSGLDLRTPYFYVGTSRNLVFRNNRFELGEDIYPYSGTKLQIENSLLVAQPTATEAIYVENSELVLTHSTIVGFPAGIRLTTPDSKLTVRNSILVNTDDLDGVTDGSTIAYNLISNGDFAGTQGNLAATPVFVDAAAGNYHLATGSPGIDAGDPAAVFTNEPFPHGCRVNMGAYGNTVEAEAASDPDGNGAYGVCPSCLGTSGNYRYTLSGKVTTSGRNPVAIPGVSMSLAGPNYCGAKATTGSDGRYSLGKLISGTYTLTPSKTGCSIFTPSNVTLSVNKNKTQNFTGACP